MLKVCEIYDTLNGESSLAGMPVRLVRFFGCNLCCAYCDTPQSYTGEYRDIELSALFDELVQYKGQHILLTGGEPLIQKEVSSLIAKLLDAGKQVVLETNGTLLCRDVPSDVHLVMDVKCPGSGQGDTFVMDNLRFLKASDDLKFVVSDMNDYTFARDFVRANRDELPCNIFISPVFGTISTQRLWDIISHDCEFGMKLQIQMHKTVWGKCVKK